MLWICCTDCLFNRPALFQHFPNISTILAMHDDIFDVLVARCATDVASAASMLHLHTAAAAAAAHPSAYPPPKQFFYTSLAVALTITKK